MEANHPIFLPRLVPHVFNQQSSTLLIMSDDRPPSSSPQKDISTPSGSPMRTTSGPPTIDPQRIVSTLSTLLDYLNVETASSIFIQLYKVHPQQAVAALLILSSGNRDSQTFKLFSTLVKGLFAADLRIGSRVLLGLFGLDLEVGFISVYKFKMMCHAYYITRLQEAGVESRSEEA